MYTSGGTQFAAAKWQKAVQQTLTFVHKTNYTFAILAATAVKTS